MAMDVDVEVHGRGKLGLREEQSGESGQGVDMGRLMNSIEITKVSPLIRNFRGLVILIVCSIVLISMFLVIARDVLATTTEFVRDPSDRISTRLHLGRR
jgi:hypothetical protein